MLFLLQPANIMELGQLEGENWCIYLFSKEVQTT